MGTNFAACGATEEHMDVDEGFILGVYNYCDRWCERCAFTSRCRVFADVAKMDAMSAGDLRPVLETPPHPTEIRTAPGWLDEALSEIDMATIKPLPDPPIPPAFAEVVERADAYRRDVWRWLEATGLESHNDVNHPIATISWFSALIGAKVSRALDGLAEFDGNRDFPPDHEGSCKVALLGIDRSITAWKDLSAVDRARSAEAEPFLAGLEQMRCDLERLIPRARAFVRPGFDEPDEVRKLEAMDWS